MKHLHKLLFTLITMLALSSHAQNSNNPWALSFGINAVDTRGSAGGGNSQFDSFASQAFLVKKNWNILPSISYIGLSRLVGNNISVGLQGSVNKINKFVVYDPTNINSNSTGYIASDPGSIMYYALDANVKYSLMSLIKSKVIDPSVRLGGGYTWFGKNSYGTLNPGMGLTFWYNDFIGLSLETTYKINQLFAGKRNDPADIYTPNQVSHFQHNLGLVFQFGGKDTDRDRIYDKDDACPEVAGLKQFNGCPDTDGDGIIDGSDACSTVFGLASLNGCPDKDGDGIADKDDTCPDTAGLAVFRGCPDTDEDGLTDKEDKCPTVAGPKSNDGCPILDTDKDGVQDKDDDCPTVAGSISNKGCPELIKEEIPEYIKAQDKSIYFNSGKSTFSVNNSLSAASINKILKIIKNYPNTKFTIEGHADSDGSEELNQKISEDRANAVRNALIKGGANPDNLTAIGLGETKPAASNKSKKGKAKNRRAEVKP